MTVEDKTYHTGEFALVQLYRSRDIGSLEAPRTMRTLWDVELYKDEDGGYRTRKIDRGPIFSARGEPRRDFDPLSFIPVWICDLSEEYGITKKSLYSGGFIPIIKSWMGSIRKTVQKRKEDNFRKHQERHTEEKERVLDRHFHRKKRDDTRSVLAKKFTRGAEEKAEKRSFEATQRIKKTMTGQSDEL